MAHDPKLLRTIVEAAQPPDPEVAFRAKFRGILACRGQSL